MAPRYMKSFKTAGGVATLYGNTWDLPHVWWQLDYFIILWHIYITLYEGSIGSFGAQTNSSQQGTYRRLVKI